MEKEVATLSSEVIDLAITVMRIIRQEFKTQAGASELTTTQFRMLNKIRSGACHVGKLSEKLDISQPATSIMVDTMVKKGLLKRVPHPTDRRQIELRLTAKATAKLETAFKSICASIDEKLSDLSTTKKSLATKQIQEMVQLLSQSEV